MRSERWQSCQGIIRRFPLTVLYKMSLSPASDNSLRFLSHCKNVSPLSIISMPRTASVINRHGGAVASTTICQRLAIAYPLNGSSDRDSKWMFYCQRKVDCKLCVWSQCSRNFPFSFLEKCRPFTGEQEFGAGKWWEWQNLFTKDSLWTILLSWNVSFVSKQITKYELYIL